MALRGKSLPQHVEREFDDFLTCGRLEHGFLRVVCGDCKHEKQLLLFYRHKTLLYVGHSLILASSL